MKKGKCKFVAMMLLTALIVGLFSPAISARADDYVGGPYVNYNPANLEKFEKTDKGWREKGIVRLMPDSGEYARFYDDMLREDNYGYYYVDKEGYLMNGWFNPPVGCFVELDYVPRCFLVNGKEVYSGWIRTKDKNGKTRIYYLEEGNLGEANPATGWRRISRSPIYFNETGEWGDDEFGDLRLGWYEYEGHRYYNDEAVPYGYANAIAEVDGHRYYFDQDGRMQTGWVNYDSYQHYFDQNGHMQTGWIKIDGSQYYFDQDGQMKTGLFEYEGHRYYFNRDGRMQIGWLIEYDERFYFDQKGRMQTGWVKIGNKQYYFNQDGLMQTGWVDIDGKSYYFEETGDNIGVYRESKTADGEDALIIQTGWVKQDKKWYYFDQDGQMKTGWLKYEGKRYYLKKDGTRKTGWLKYKGKRYYFNKDGVMKTGWVKYKKKWYYFAKSGIMKTGWVKYKKNWYYLTKNGTMKTGWQKRKGSWYYLKKSGKMAKNETLTIKGKEHQFAEDGKLIN